MSKGQRYHCGPDRWPPLARRILTFIIGNRPCQIHDADWSMVGVDKSKSDKQFGKNILSWWPWSPVVALVAYAGVALGGKKDFKKAQEKAKMLKKLKEILIRHEGIRLFPYRCTANKLTIGIGLNLEDDGITLEEAHYLFDNGVGRKIAAIEKNLEWFKDLSEARKIVIISMVFNLGMGGFLKFKKTIQFIKDGCFWEASIEMLESKWKDDVGQRAHELSNMMAEG